MENVGGIEYIVDAKTDALLNSSKVVDKAVDSMTKKFGEADKAVDKTNFKMKESAKAVKEASTGFDTLSRRMGAFISIAGALQAATISEGYREMAERIAMATESTEEYEHVQQRLLATANGTYRSLKEAQELFILTSGTLKDLGYNTDQALDVVDSMSYSFVRNATSVDRANNAINAFTNSMQRGRVEADGWASIIRATPSIVNDIAAATGKTTEEIRKLGASGKLTADMLTEGLRKSLEENKAAADGMFTTLRDAMQKASNSVSMYLGESERLEGSIKLVSTAIVTLAENIDSVVLAMGVLGGAALARYIAGLGLMIKASIAAGTATTALTAKLAVLQGVLGGPVGIAALLLGAGAAYLFFRDRTKEADDAVRSFKDGLLELTDDALAEKSAEAAKKLASETEKLAAVNQKWAKTLDNAANAGQRSNSFMAAQVKTAKEEIAAAQKRVDAQKKLVDLINAETERRKPRNEEVKLNIALTKEEIELEKKRAEEAKRAAEKLAEARANDINLLQDLRDQLDQTSASAEQLAISAARASLSEFASADTIKQVDELARALFRAEEAAKLREMIGNDPEAFIRGGDRGGLQGGQYDNQFSKYTEDAAAEEKYYAAQLERAIKARDAEVTSAREHHAMLETLEREHVDRMNRIQSAQYMMAASAAEQGFGALADVMRTAQGEQSTIYKVMFATSKAFAVAQSALSVATAIADAADAGPFPANLAAMATVMGATAGLVANVQAITMAGARRYGGNVSSGANYRINEGGVPEVYTNGKTGNSYLLGGDKGTVTPLGELGGGSSFTINLIEDKSRAGSVTKAKNESGGYDSTVFVASIYGDGPEAKALENKYGLIPRGR